MASNPPSDCCIKASLHEGTPVGKVQQFGGVESYVTGEKTGKYVIMVTDVFGHKFTNNQLVADAFGKCGFQVIVPDLFNGKPVEYPLPEGFDFPAFLAENTAEKITAIVEGVLAGVKEEKPSFVGATGYCFGAKYAIKLLADPSKIDAAAIAHPSFVTEEEVRAVKNPLFIAAAEVDRAYSEDMRKLTEKILIENEITYFTTLASKCEHGFAIKGDLSKPHVKFAKEKCFTDFCQWFKFIDSLKQ